MQDVAPQSRVSGNGFGLQKLDSGGVREMENNTNVQIDESLNPNSNFNTTQGSLHDRLIYMATCLIGHQVEVHVENGSVYSGIFHSTNADDKDFGIILKMARLVKYGSFKGQNLDPDIITVPPLKTLIIPAEELVQVFAKDVSVTGNDVSKGPQGEKRKDLMIDSSISKFHSVEEGRKLERWIPDDNDSQCPDLENVFDNTNNRKWDQFETNKTLFGVESTFDEEIYTTKLVKGPQMKELERKAIRIAREIEGEDTQDLHLAEERGLHLHDDFSIDEETKYSSVSRGHDDSGYEKADDIVLDSKNDETFGGSSSSIINKSSDTVQGKNNDRATASSTCSTDEESSSLNRRSDHPWSRFSDQAGQVDDKKRMKDNQTGEQHEEDKCKLEIASSTSDGTAAVAPTSSQLEIASSTSDGTAAVAPTSSPGLSSSSSLSSLSSEKSKLNPLAREFKLNPNAKSFTPMQAPLRPPSPVADASFYFPANPSAVQYMHGLPVGFGIGPAFPGPHPFMYGFQALPIPTPRAFVHPNGPPPPPVYGQQMSHSSGQQMSHSNSQQMSHSNPRQQVLYMPTYPHEMTNKRRES